MACRGCGGSAQVTTAVTSESECTALCVCALTLRLQPYWLRKGWWHIYLAALPNFPKYYKLFQHSKP
eukprot:scaffold238515_cov32-Tisochrysis_lutea.AAC.2